MCPFHFRGKEQIHNQIQRRLDEKQIQSEMKELEKQQVRENQERMDLEDLKVRTQPTQRLST